MQQSKIEQLESLRGVAALIVFLGHFTLAFAPQRHGQITGAIQGGNLKETPFFFFLNGTASVTLFFVLSGFVLSYGYFENPEKSITGAIIRRWPRLVPIALGSTLLSFLIYKSGLYFHAAASEITHSDWMSKFGYASQQLSESTGLIDSIAQGAFLTFFRGSSDSWMNSSLWTMHLELVGSFIVFGLVAVVRNSKPADACSVFVMAGVLAFFGDMYLPLFVAGVALAYFHGRNQWPIVSSGKCKTLIKLSIIFNILGYLDPGTGFYQFAKVFSSSEVYFRIFMHGAASVFLIHLALVDGNIRWFLSMRPLCFLGRISFPFYALHVPLIFSLSAGFFVKIVSSEGYNLSAAITLALTLAIIFPLSYLFSIIDQRWRDFLRGK